MEKQELKQHIAKGCSIQQLAKHFGISQSSIRYWLKKYSLKTQIPLHRRSWSDSQLVEAVKGSISLRQVILKLGLSPRPGNYPTIKKRIKELQLDIKHILGSGHGTGGTTGKTLEEMLIEHSPYNRTAIKKKIIKAGLLKYSCTKCSNSGLWRGKELVLILDHINGIGDDYRKENLRLLCPNCNSQQDTFCGKNKSKSRRNSIYEGQNCLR